MTSALAVARRALLPEACSRATIMCQCHGSRFDIRTGAVINGPATEALNVYRVEEVDGSIQIRV